MTDISKYQNVEVTLTDGSDPIRYWVLTGEILKSDQLSHTSVSSSGGSYTDGTARPVSISSRTWTTNTIFFKCGDKERSVEITDNTVPIRPGNRVSFFAAKRQHETNDWRYVALYNHDTDEGGLVHGGSHIKPQGWIKSIFYLASWSVPIVILPMSCANLGKHFQSLDFVLGAFFGFVPGVLAYVSVDTIFKKRMKKRLTTDVRKLFDCIRAGNDLKSLDAERP